MELKDSGGVFKPWEKMQGCVFETIAKMVVNTDRFWFSGGGLEYILIILSMRYKGNKGTHYVKGQGRTRHLAGLVIFREIVRKLPENEQKDFKDSTDLIKSLRQLLFFDSLVPLRSYCRQYDCYTFDTIKSPTSVFFARHLQGSLFLTCMCKRPFFYLSFFSPFFDCLKNADFSKSLFISSYFL